MSRLLQDWHLTIGSEALPGRLEGSIYIGEPRPGDQYRLLLTASGFGIHVKLIGSAVPDETTGRLTIHFPELPQAPFSDFQLHLFAPDRGLMATPTACTIYTTDANFIPWNEPFRPAFQPDFRLDRRPTPLRMPWAGSSLPPDPGRRNW